MGHVADEPVAWDEWLAVCGLKREAAIWGGRAVIGGGRSDLLAARLEAAIAAERPAGLISFGVAGALHEGLRVGDVFVGGSVVTQRGEHWRCDEAARATLGGASGVVAGSDRIVDTPEAKSALRALAGVVDMESHIAARAAAADGLPLAVLRVVSDEAGHSLPPAALAGMTADGGANVPAVLAALFRDPRQLPALMRLGRDSGKAFATLRVARRALHQHLSRLREREGPKRSLGG